MTRIESWVRSILFGLVFVTALGMVWQLMKVQDELGALSEQLRAVTETVDRLTPRQ